MPKRSNAATAKSKKADPVKAEAAVKRQVTMALKALTDPQIECRSYRYHAFKKVRIFRWSDSGGKGICRISRCSRGCGVGREDYYNRKGELVDRIYDYPEGYQIKGHGYLTSDKVMRELFARATDIAASREDAGPLARHLAVVGGSR